MLEEQDNLAAYALYLNFTEEDGLSSKEAVKKLRLSFTYFYWSLSQREDEKHEIAAEDAKLPWVLKDRLTRAFTSGLVPQDGLNTASSMNALMRDLIRKGQI